MSWPRKRANNVVLSVPRGWPGEKCARAFSLYRPSPRAFRFGADCLSSSGSIGLSSSRPDCRLRFGDLLNELGRVEHPSCRRGDEPSWGDDSPRPCKSER